MLCDKCISVGTDFECAVDLYPVEIFNGLIDDILATVLESADDSIHSAPVLGVVEGDVHQSFVECFGSEGVSKLHVTIVPQFHRGFRVFVQDLVEVELDVACDAVHHVLVVTSLFV